MQYIEKYSIVLDYKLYMYLTMCQKDGEQQLQWGQMMVHSLGYPTDIDRQSDREERSCKGMLQDSLGNLVWVSIIQLALGSLEPTIYSSLSSCSHCHSQYYIALLGMVVISVLVYVSIVTSVWTKLVQYIQLVMYGKIPYLNINWNFWAIHRSFLSLSLLLMLSMIRDCH